MSCLSQIYELFDTFEARGDLQIGFSAKRPLVKLKYYYQVFFLIPQGITRRCISFCPNISTCTKTLVPGLLMLKSDLKENNIPDFMDKVMASKGEPTVWTCSNVTGQSKGPKTKLHLISAVFWEPLSCFCSWDEATSLLVEINSRHTQGAINVEKPLPHLFPSATLGATTSIMALLSELMALTGRIKKKNVILIIGLGDTREEKWKRAAGKPFVPSEAAQPS